jgi:Fur family transcriptional regulator, ferric uptake regulator
MKASVELLKKFDLRLTSCREDILEEFILKTAALSHSYLENQVGNHYDRVTIYRTLKTFVEKGLIHKIPDDDGGIKYALCQQECNHKKHNHDHVHFKCNECGDTTCISSLNIPEIILPEGYIRQDVNMLVQGICAACAN